MRPNMSPPVDRSAETLQGIKYPARTFVVSGGAGASSFACNLCLASCDPLMGVPKTLCQIACKSLVC